jgi:hypothetical protein
METFKVKKGGMETGMQSEGGRGDRLTEGGRQSGTQREGWRE